VKDVWDLVRTLENYPEWQAEPRHLIQTKERLALPGLMRELAQAQRRTVIPARERAV
jgi:hypothetical protein